MTGGVLSDQDIRAELGTRMLIEPLSPDTIRENGVDLRIGDIQDGNGPFVLAVTKETVALPDNVVGLCNLRSTWARKGFFIPPTVIDAGFAGELTIELVRLDEDQAWPRADERFLHVVFLYTATPCYKVYSGKYQGQKGITPAKEDK